MARAIFAAVIATLVAAGLIYLNGQMAALPPFPLLAEIQTFNARIGMPASDLAAWAAHAILGILVYGVIFALIQPILPGRGLGEGLVFGFITWLAMMVVFAPLTGHELFMRDLDPVLIALSLVFNLVYGAALGIAFAAAGGAGDAAEA
ncbi:DUF6789 family protein [Acuticoccus sp. I52.16.1]|uniref:DUF6789 family protein n=1 Tax=Acuticoccus sp. I52.16.1 TaxID=2928472 RepID=UPI001FD2CDDE|nr:DUF6789 family protein [Acuticoccus sp. I52.16.1]UOM33418.1 hypothetical protein MRB58_16365 [Acuticoccus sp. I52.16.1]